MADILSQSQIDELLNSFSEVGTKAFEEIEADEKGKKAKQPFFSAARIVHCTSNDLKKTTTINK